MNIETNKIFAKCFLFRGLDELSISKLLDMIKPKIGDYERGDCIYSPDSFDRRAGIVLYGECSIFQGSSIGKDIPLNTVTSPGCFGITAALCGRDDFPTVIIAKKRCKIAFITGDDIKTIAKASSVVALNIIEFMSERICFLNDKIATFSGDNVEQKLARYIIRSLGAKPMVPCIFNKKHASEAINAGRASLYRALDSLSSSGMIELKEKTLIITDYDGLERISK